MAHRSAEMNTEEHDMNRDLRPQPKQSAQTLSLEFKTISERRAAAPAEERWLWQGYVKRGGVTLFTGQWKSGKTTLVSLLLARMKTGGELAGLPVTSGRAVVLSEEGEDL